MRPSALDGRRLAASRALVAPLRLEWFEADWGEGMRTRGYRVVDAGGAEWREADLEDIGLLSIGVAGVTHRRPSLQSAGFEPGEPVILMPEPDNPHDPFALAVMDLGLAEQAGYVPAVRSRALVEEMVRRPLHAMALAEHREAGEGGARVGLRVLAGFAPLLESRA
jgi:hypothetical protein